MSVECSNDGDPRPFVKKFGSDVGKLLKTNDSDPAGLLFGRVESNVEGRYRIPFRAVKHFGIRTKVSGQNALVEHKEILLSDRIFEIQEYP